MPGTGQGKLQMDGRKNVKKKRRQKFYESIVVLALPISMLELKALLPAQTSSGEYGWEKLKPHGGLLGGSKRTLRSNSGFITAGARRHNCKKFVKFMGKSSELL